MKHTNHHVLAVGINDYTSAKKLKACHDDAKQFASCLARKGFQTVVLESVQMETVRAELRKLVEAAQHEEDTLVFYFSGHGLDIGGEQILLGPDFGGDLKSAYEDKIRLAELLEAFSRSPANKVIIVDACRTPSTKPLEIVDLQEHEAGWHDTVKKCPKVTILYATGVGQTAHGASGDIPISRFTHYLIGNLKDYDKSFADAFFLTAKNLTDDPNSGNQAPWFFTSAGNGVIADAGPISATTSQSASLSFETCQDSALALKRTFMLDSERGISTNEQGVRKRIAYSSNDRPIRLSIGGQANTAVVLERTCARLIKGLASIIDTYGKAKPPFDKIATKKLHQEITGVAFAEVSPQDQYVVVGSLFYESTTNPHYRTKGATLNAWVIGGRNKSIALTPPAGLDANAALWIANNQCLIAFSSVKTMRSEIWHLVLDGSTCTAFQKKFGCKGIVTSFAKHRSDTIVLGLANGTVEIRELNGKAMYSFARTATLNQERLFLMKNWSDEDGRANPWKNAPAVASTVYLPDKNVLAVGYFDLTVSFYDLELAGHIASFAPPANESHSLVRILPGSGNDSCIALIGKTTCIYRVGFK